MADTAAVDSLADINIESESPGGELPSARVCALIDELYEAVQEMKPIEQVRFRVSSMFGQTYQCRPYNIITVGDVARGIIRKLLTQPTLARPSFSF